jgi:alpha-D-xyloside xylohydrolase
VHGGQTIVASAPIDTIPLFVRAGSILPMGEPVESTKEQQKIATLRIYTGADSNFTLYQDDGTTYAYEEGKADLTHLRWADASGKLTFTGPKAWIKADSQVIEVVGR